MVPFGDSNRKLAPIVYTFDVTPEFGYVTVRVVIVQADEVRRAAGFDGGDHEIIEPVSFCQTRVSRGRATHALPSRLDDTGTRLEQQLQNQRVPPGRPARTK